VLFAGVLAVAVGAPAGAFAVAAGHDGQPSPFPPPVVQTIQPSALARPDQFVFIEMRFRTLEGWMESQTWSSVDGTQGGMSRVRLIGTDTWKVTSSSCVTHCQPPPHFQPPYRAGLPTTGDAMRAYLRSVAGSVAAGDVFAVTQTMLEGHLYLTPAQVSALFDALKETPGLSVGRDTVDALGRPGLSISWISPNGEDESEFMFDASAHAYHGLRYVYLQDGSGHRKGDVISQTVRIRQAIVDRSGEVP
jgi:hypothetical protein